LATEAGGLGLVAQGKSGEDLAPLWMPELTDENLRGRLRAYAAGYSAWLASPREKEKQQGWLAALDEALKWLWDACMGSVAGALEDGGRATLVPTGPLGLLPLHAAWTPARGKATKRRYALDALAFRYAPSARALLPALQSASRLTPSALLAVDEPLPVSAGRLPNSEDEVRSVAAHFPSSRVLSHEAATHQALLAEMKNYPVLHFSCHGLAQLMDPLSSGLVMAHDEMLSLRDLLDLRPQSTRLAVLSACETGLPGAELPDEVVSLPAGLLQAGAAGVIASLWSVSDISTAILMVRCYEQWRKKKKEPMEALRLAQQWLTSTADKMKLAAWYERKYETSGRTDQEALGWMDYYRKNPASRPFQHPYFWAGFFFTGA
jgi:CHAT domain-containing protein